MAVIEKAEVKMRRRYRIIDCQPPSDSLIEHFCEAQTPEEAARLALGSDLMRAGTPAQLRAKVYYATANGSATMVRLYNRLKDRA